MSSFAGMQQGHFWGTSSRSVDVSKPPLATPIPPPTLLLWAKSGLTLSHVIWSPNLIWLVISVALYILFPYDESLMNVGRQGAITSDYFQRRLPFWMAVVIGYFLFWHITIESWCRRSFIPNRPYRLSKVLHNLFYCVTGVVIWVGFENVFVYLWSSGKLAYMSDKEAFSSLTNMTYLILGMLIIPLWRDGHFYFAHRMIHFRPLFRYIHSLHHRNTDVEVFSGLCMHPVEHLYYYACVLPCLIIPIASPLHFHFIGVHMLLAPAASHSGYEDHWQSDAFHYFHHRYFEVNFAGLGCSFLDTWFGSFCGALREKTPLALRDDAKATANILASPPTFEFVAYIMSSVLCVGLWINLVQGNSWAASLISANVAAYVAGYGPVAIAVAATAVQEGTSSLIRPFDRRPKWETFLHVAVGTYFCSYPITLACQLAANP